VKIENIIQSKSIDGYTSVHVQCKPPVMFDLKGCTKKPQKQLDGIHGINTAHSLEKDLV